MNPELLGALIGSVINLVVLWAAIEVAKYGWGKKSLTHIKYPWQEELWILAIPFMKWFGLYLILQQVLLLSVTIWMVLSNV